MSESPKTLFNEDNFLKKLESVQPTTDSIQSMALWIIHYKTNHELITRLWLKKLKECKHGKQALTLLYLANDVIQNCKRKNAKIFQDSFKSVLVDAIPFARHESIRKNVERILSVWQERRVYDQTFISTLFEALRKDDVPKHVPQSPPILTPTPKTPKKTTNDEEETKIKELVSQFEPKRFFEALARFGALEKETDTKRTLVDASKICEANVESVRQYRDKAQCERFAADFATSRAKLCEFIGSLEGQSAERQRLVKMLQQAEVFYDAQYRDAKLVANAYKSFAHKLSSMKKRLDEMLEKMSSSAANSSTYSSSASDAKLDNLDMEMSSSSEDEETSTRLKKKRDDDSPILSYSARIRQQQQQAKSDQRGQPIPTISSKTSLNSSANIRTHLDPRQNRLVPTNSAANNVPTSSNKYLQEMECTTPVRDESESAVSSSNSLDFLTKFINKSSSSVSLTAPPPPPPPSQNSLLSSLQKFTHDYQEQQNMAYDPSAAYYPTYETYSDEYMGIKKARNEPERAATPTKDETYQQMPVTPTVPVPPPMVPPVPMHYPYYPPPMMPYPPPPVSYPPIPHHPYIPPPPPPVQQPQQPYQPSGGMETPTKRKAPPSQFSPHSGGPHRSFQQFGRHPHHHHQQQQQQQQQPKQKSYRIPTINSQRDRNNSSS